MRIAVWAILMVALVGTPGAGQVVSAPALPASVGAYELTETRIFADPLLGTWYRYAAGRERVVEVMVQPSVTAEGRAATGEDTIERAVASFKTVRMRQAGTRPMQFAVDRPDTVVVGARIVRGHIVQANIGSDAERTTVLQVYPLGGRYVRIVGAVPVGSADRELASFAQRLLPAILAAWGL